MSESISYFEDKGDCNVILLKAKYESVKFPNFSCCCLIRLVFMATLYLISLDFTFDKVKQNIFINFNLIMNFAQLAFLFVFGCD